MCMPVFPTPRFLEASKSLLITGSRYSGLNHLLELAEKRMRNLRNCEHAEHAFSVGKMSRVKGEGTQASPPHHVCTHGYSVLRCF